MLVKGHWPNLYKILGMYLDLNSHETLDKDLIEETLGVFITKLKEEEDERLLHYLHEAWWKAPDKPTIHQIPGWGILCDLCSESWVFGE